jgi:tRNA 2-thiouridine synthesizing protein A
MVDLNTFDVELDTLGLTCPMPMLKTKKAVGGLKSGQILRVLGDEPGSKNDIPGFVEKNGHELLAMEDVPEGYTVYIIKKG